MTSPSSLSRNSFIPNSFILSAEVHGEFSRAGEGTRTEALNGARGQALHAWPAPFAGGSWRAPTSKNLCTRMETMHHE